LRTVANPITALAQLLARFTIATVVAIAGFYDSVKPLEDWSAKRGKLPVDGEN